MQFCETCNQPVLSDYCWNADNGQLLVDGKVVQFTRDQTVIMDALLEKPGRVVLHHTLIGKIHGCMEPADADNSLKAQICYMRKKLRGTSFHIPNVKGKGYSVTQEIPK